MGTLLYSVAWLTGWVFLGLKLAGAISWPWLLVSIPFIVAGGWTVFVVAFWLALGGVAIGAAAVAQRKQQNDLFNRLGRNYGRRI